MEKVIANSYVPLTLFSNRSQFFFLFLLQMLPGSVVCWRDYVPSWLFLDPLETKCVVCSFRSSPPGIKCVMVVKEGALEEGTVATACLRVEDEHRRDKRDRRGSPEGRSKGTTTCMTHISLKPWWLCSPVPLKMERLLDLSDFFNIFIIVYIWCYHCWRRVCVTR